MPPHQSKSTISWKKSPEVHFKVTDSTNEQAKRWLKAYTPAEGTLIRADHQTGGKGQRGRNWHDLPGGSLLVSIILYPDFILPEKHFMLNVACSVAVMDMIEKVLPAEHHHEFALKWPNDIYRNSRKLGGILNEASIQEGRFSWCVCGLGLNVLSGSDDSYVNLQHSLNGHQSVSANEKAEGNFDKNAGLTEEKKLPAFLWEGDESNDAITVARLSKMFRECFFKRYEELRSGFYDGMLLRYEEYLKGFKSSFWVFDGEKSLGKGKVLGVKKNGELEVETDNGIEVLKWGQHQIMFN